MSMWLTHRQTHPYTFVYSLTALSDTKTHTLPLHFSTRPKQPNQTPDSIYYVLNWSYWVSPATCKWVSPQRVGWEWGPGSTGIAFLLLCDPLSSIYSLAYCKLHFPECTALWPHPVLFPWITAICYDNMGAIVPTCHDLTIFQSLHINLWRSWE